MPHSLAYRIRTLLPELPGLDGWQWIPAGQFDYKKSYGHLPGTEDPQVECIMRRCSAVVEHSDPNVIVRSSIWETIPPPDATIIDDILMLLSIAKSQHIAVKAQQIWFSDGGYRIRQRAIAPEANLKEVVSKESIRDFIVDSLATLQKQDWKEYIGFVPAIDWYAQAQRLFRTATFSLVVSLYWIALEILSRTYIQNQGLLGTIQDKKKRVKEFTNVRGFTGASWSFLDGAIDDWYVVRNAAFHEGKLPAWAEQKFEQRGRQMAEFTSFVLADLLQGQSPSQKDQIGLRLSGY